VLEKHRLFDIVDVKIDEKLHRGDSGSINDTSDLGSC